MLAVCGAFTLYLALLASISIRQLRNQKIRQQTAIELRAAQLKLHEADKLRIIGSLTGGISFYFMEIMQSVSSLLLLINEEIGDSPVVGNADGLIRDEVQRGLYLSSQLQRLSISTMNEIAAISVSGLIGTISKLPLPQSVNLSTDIVLAKDSIEGNQGLLIQMLQNVVTNAIDAMPEGGALKIKVRRVPTDSVYVNLDPSQEYIRLSISDTGMGIPEDDQEHMFEPQFTTKDRDDRTGLGLSFVYGIVRLHNGEIDIKSSNEKGTTVNITLPTKLSLARDGQATMSDLNPLTAHSYAGIIATDSQIIGQS